MSKIIELIITFVLYYLIGLGSALLVMYIENRKFDKYISNKMSEFRESCAALDESQDESRAQVDEIDESTDEIGESTDEIGEDMDEMSESFDEIHQSLDKIDKSFDKIDKSLDRINESVDEKDESSNEKDEYIEGLIEFTRIMRDYSDYKTKMIEARENFCESQFSDEKNIH